MPVEINDVIYEMCYQMGVSGVSKFKKTLLYNRKLYELDEQEKITKEEMTIILGVSSDYIDYIFKTVYKNDK